MACRFTMVCRFTASYRGHRAKSVVRHDHRDRLRCIAEQHTRVGARARVLERIGQGLLNKASHPRFPALGLGRIPTSESNRRRWSAPSALLGEQGRVPGQVQRPSGVLADTFADGLPARPGWSMWRCSSFTRVRLGVSAMNRTSTSLVWSEAVSICHCGPMSQLNLTRSVAPSRASPRGGRSSVAR